MSLDNSDSATQRTPEPPRWSQATITLSSKDRVVRGASALWPPDWTLQEMVNKPPALCPGHGRPPPRLAGCTCPVHSPRACLTLMGSVMAELSPTPASLTDLIQNSYSFPVLSPGIVNLGEKCAAFRDGQTVWRHP